MSDTYAGLAGKTDSNAANNMADVGKTEQAVMTEGYTDDAIRERHGCACRTGENYASTVTVWESESWIYLDGACKDRALTPWQARYLAAKLCRLSRRVRDRRTRHDPRR